jgi:tRNA(Ile)-lysidine synthase
VTEAGIIRPLLEVERHEIETDLRGKGIHWREDPSNQDAAFSRNRIRHDLLPLLEREWNPGIRRGLARTAELLAGEESFWREWAARTIEELAHPAGGQALILDLAKLQHLHSAQVRRLLRAAVERVRGGLRRIDQEHISRLAALGSSARGSGTVRLPGLTAIRSFDQLLLAGEPALRGDRVEITVSAPGAVPWPEGGALRIRYNTNAGFAPGSIEPPVVVRGWRPGDAYQPAGSSRRRKLKDLFHEHKVPSWERRSWPIIERDGQIVWARRFGWAAGVELNWTCEDEMTLG